MKIRECPKCKGVARLITPLKAVNERTAVYTCRTKGCAFTFREGGGIFVKDSDGLMDFFRGATLSQRTLVEALGGENLNQATKMALQALLIEYGAQMWFDGLKQGLLIGATKEDSDEKIRSG